MHQLHNGNWEISAYLSDTVGWTFSGNGRREDENALVAGMDKMLNYYAKTKNGITSMIIQFGEYSKFNKDFYKLTLKLIEDHDMDKYNDKGIGNRYFCEELGIIGWLCPVLFDFFMEAPETLYIGLK